MPKHYRLWLGAGAVLATIALLAFAYSGVTITAAVLSFIAGLLIASGFSNKQQRYSSTTRLKAEDSENGKDATQSFALAKLFDATMNGMREGLLVVDTDMRVVASNSAAHRLFNPNDRSLNGRRLTELTRNPAIYNAFLDALRGTEKTGVKVEIHEPTRRIFDLRVVPLSDSAQGSEGAIGVFFDVSKLEKLERVRQEFLSNVSHELRTPLTAILAFVETLETSTPQDDAEYRRFLAIIRKNASRMHTLIDDILELGAIEAGNVRVEPCEIELYPLVSDVVASLASKAAAHKIAVEILISREARFFADPKRLEQMLTNLLDNAIKFNREGGQVIIRNELDGVQRLQVKDTGEGIPAQHLERLFERFYRVDRARSKALGGTGLGLAIVKHLARAHGGEVTVQSKLGEGSLFSIELPRRQATGR